MGHCQGGAATDSIDGLGALVDWVENGKAPDTLNAKGTTVYPGRTRPLCAYPKYAHYKGTGTAEDAANFSCRCARLTAAESNLGGESAGLIDGSLGIKLFGLESAANQMCGQAQCRYLVKQGAQR